MYSDAVMKHYTMPEKSARKVFIRTYGCQMNEADSEKIKLLLQTQGYECTSLEEEADLILLNTCCVRETAEQKAYGKIGDLRRLKLRNPSLRLGVGGCVSAKEGTTLITRFPWVDFIFSPEEIERLPQILNSIFPEENLLPQVSSGKRPICSDENRTGRKISAYVTAIKGCNNFCSFCIVPYVRGREKSRPLSQIVEEIEEGVQRGIREITLLGQNILAYGRDLEKDNQRINFIDLLEEVSKIEGIERIRFITSHPRDLNEDIIYKVKEKPVVCEYFHLPLQAGDDEILRRMHRGYTRDYYRSQILKIREIIPEATITTDIIVGFPGETDRQFENSLELVKELRFDSVFTFIYSPRKGTKAFNFPEQVPIEIKKERLYLLNQVVNKIVREKNEELVGKEMEILVEGFKDEEEGILKGRTRGNKIVYFKGDKGLIGRVVKVRIKKAHNWNLEGEL